VTRPPPLSPGLEAVFAPHRAPLPLPPAVVSRAMARATAAAMALSAHRRRRMRFSSWWVFAAASGVVLMLGAGAYAARAWIHAPSPRAPAAPAPSLWQPSRAPRSGAAAAIGQPPGPTPEIATRRRALIAMAATADAATVTTSAELELLRTARRDVTRGDYAGALAAIGQHRRRFENGTLVEEREALRIKSLAGIGRAKEARAAAAAFRTRFPHSVFRSTFERLREGER
jgi:hypothetical protein